ncbi:lytic murein transglycosylase B [Shewanella dokdonensis]|uniref:Lytic murein transglycosylase B n=1 Tax=Shewanella dokdonensis TaxID=712036 RepID=A0ABX8DCS4_9GAMM|nr:lytic murein transglycosylase B [Shewanella dokdonensis]MCL1073743.1 lytic murein transglycosylase B [Shewanella dokdonensis]QVK22540.1 lytic murein transglycosylase B [Shewanella dokdonensis]
MPISKQLLALLLLAITPLASAATTPTYEQLQQQFIEKQQQQGFTAKEVTQFLANAHKNQQVLDAIAKPWEAKPWYQYYPLFLTDERLQAGLNFWQQHQEAINRAAKQYQIEPEIIVAIIGIETFYGKFLGNYPVVDALYTLGFYYPPRADFFRSELGKLMVLLRQEQLDGSSLNGSYAGAMGFGQFIPSSYLAYAVDFDHDGKRDLVGSAVDAIGSVANYFHQHGWQQGQAVAVPLNVTGQPAAHIWQPQDKLTQTAADILAPNVALAQSMDLDISQPAMLIQLQQAEANEYWLGLNNFYVITRYNRSPLYAMVVYQFSQQLRQHHATH